MVVVSINHPWNTIEINLRKEHESMYSGYHEENLSPETKDIHRSVKSLIEELEAFDWYNQRVDVTQDEELKAILAHNRDEEVEHAAMLLEWLRRKLPAFDDELKDYLFTEGDVTKIEEMLESQEEGNEEQKTNQENKSLGL